MNLPALAGAILFWLIAWALNEWLVRQHFTNRTLGNAARFAVPLLFGVTILVLWEGIVRGFGVPSVLLPAPSMIWARLVNSVPTLAADFRQARAISTRVDAFGRVGYLSNEFAGIDARTSVDGGIAYKLLLGPVHTLRVDGGLGYSHESRTRGADLSFALANFGSAYKWQISPTADLAEAVLLTQSLEDGEDRRLSNTIALTAALTRVLSLKFSHELKFTNAPVPTFEKTDTQVSMALVASF